MQGGYGRQGYHQAGYQQGYHQHGYQQGYPQQGGYGQRGRRGAGHAQGTFYDQHGGFAAGLHIPPAPSVVPSMLPPIYMCSVAGLA